MVDIEQHPEAADIVEQANGGNQTVPTLVYADGSALTNPSLAQVKDKLALAPTDPLPALRCEPASLGRHHWPGAGRRTSPRPGCGRSRRPPGRTRVPASASRLHLRRG